MPFVTCSHLKAAMHRGFATWSDNSARISFVDVTEECEKLGRLDKDCPLAELWVTALGGVGGDGVQGLTIDDASSTNGSVAESLGGGVSAATAEPIARYSENFRYSNGNRPAASKVIETYGAVISFNTELCWCASGQARPRAPPCSCISCTRPTTRAGRAGCV